MQDIIFSKSDSHFNLHLTCIIILNSFCYLLIILTSFGHSLILVTLCFVKLAFAFSDYFFSQTNRKVQNNISPCHVAEQKVLTISHRNNKNSSHFLQPQHGNTTRGEGCKEVEKLQNHSKKGEKNKENHTISKFAKAVSRTLLCPRPLPLVISR